MHQSSDLNVTAFWVVALVGHGTRRAAASPYNSPYLNPSLSKQQEQQVSPSSRIIVGDKRTFNTSSLTNQKQFFLTVDVSCKTRSCYQLCQLPDTNKGGTEFHAGEKGWETIIFTAMRYGINVRGIQSNGATLHLTAEHQLRKSLEEDRVERMHTGQCRKLAVPDGELMVATEPKQEQQN